MVMTGAVLLLVNQDAIDRVAKAMTTIPDGLAINPKLKRVIEGRKTAITSGENIDWATAEHLAFGTLLIEGILSGYQGRIRAAEHFHSVMRSL